jgi:hypothetical protein
MRVTWITDDKHAPSIVEYGTEKGRYDESATGEHTSYTYFRYSSGKIHHVKIGPLKPSTTYFYKCGSSGQEFSFNTPPSTFPVAFAIVGESPHPFKYDYFSWKRSCSLLELYA